MRAIEMRLQQENPQFRMIWVQYSNHRGYRFILTLFPHGYGSYQLVSGTGIDNTYETINKILQDYLVKSN